MKQKSRKWKVSNELRALLGLSCQCSTVELWQPNNYLTNLLLIIRLTYANVQESMGKSCSCMQFILSDIFFYYKSCGNLYQYYKPHKNQYQVLQVTCAVSKCAMKLKICMINHSHHSIMLYRKIITRLLPLALLLVLCTCNSKSTTTILIHISEVYGINTTPIPQNPHAAKKTEY